MPVDGGGAHRPDPERTAGRCTYHDPLRAYALELATRVDPDFESTAARNRLLDHPVEQAPEDGDAAHEVHQSPHSCRFRPGPCDPKRSCSA